jgi:hypothetical protein
MQTRNFTTDSTINQIKVYNNHRTTKLEQKSFQREQTQVNDSCHSTLFSKTAIPTEYRSMSPMSLFSQVKSKYKLNQQEEN